MLFINTRPIQRAEPLTQALQADFPHIDVLSLPLLETTPTPFNKTDHDYLSQLLENYYQLLIVISPTSAKLGSQSLEIHDQKQSMMIHSTVVAVGDSTAGILKKCLKKHGVDDVVIPDSHSNEGMMSLECIKQLKKNSRVLIWKGQGGRDLLINHLRNRQVQVDVLDLYRRQRPNTTLQIYQQSWFQQSLINNQKKTVLISSAESFQHWHDIITLTQKSAIKRTNSIEEKTHQASCHRADLQDFIYLVLGERLQKLLIKQTLTDYRVDNLKPDTLGKAVIACGVK